MGSARSFRSGLFTIGSGVPFLSSLIDALFEGRFGESLFDTADPFSLLRLRVYLPTRRSCHVFRKELSVRFASTSFFLPRIYSLNELVFSSRPASVPALGFMERKLLLMELITECSSSGVRVFPGSLPGGFSFTSLDHVARLATDLACLMESAEEEGVEFSSLAPLYLEHQAHHCQDVADFLKILTENWPRILSRRHARLSSSFCDALTELSAPAFHVSGTSAPVIVAGSRGSSSSTARFLSEVAASPQGAVILRGLDLDMDEKSWMFLTREGKEAYGHPQYGLARLLRFLGKSRLDVEDIGPVPSAPCLARRRLAGHGFFRSFSPVSAFDFLSLPSDKAPETASPAVASGESVYTRVYEGVTYIEAADEQEEALIIALMMREAAEEPGRRLALITPCRSLVRRVVSELSRWGIVPLDSAGLPLSQTLFGHFARLSAELLTGHLSPLSLLPVLKHALCRLGKPPGWAGERARILEKLIFRGASPMTGIAGLRSALRAIHSESRKDAIREAGLLIDQLELCLSCFSSLSRTLCPPLHQVAEVHETLFLNLTGDVDAETEGEGCKEILELLKHLSRDKETSLLCSLADYPGVLASFLSDEHLYYHRRATHRHLQIWGLMEARLLPADRLIMGGLNEGIWPFRVEDDLWLNPAIRKALGLFPLEWRIGLSAHDFVEGFTHPDVVLTRSLRSQNTQTVASRWLFHLDAALKSQGQDTGLQKNDETWKKKVKFLRGSWHHQTIFPPCPCPPLSARPRHVSVTQAEGWLQNPYNFYARHILHLEPLPLLNSGLNKADWGMKIHEILGSFVETAGASLGTFEEERTRLLTLGARNFSDLADMSPDVTFFWWRRFLRIADWFVRFELQRSRGFLTRSHTERSGVLSWGEGAYKFVLKTRTDRLDFVDEDRVILYDYKTGRVPSSSDVKTGKSVQLPLMAAILLGGGFGDFAPPRDVTLSYIRLSAGMPPGEYIEISASGADLASRALSLLKEWVGRFDCPAQAYEASLSPHASSDSYAHLSRVGEWAANAGRRAPEGGDLARSNA
ncbi:MAG: double-strand break repair protein AddB [Alphaproteobacteria bacterium]|nr:double-strand break repair protein AddB [Alphaproteobacteria bacterium]